MQRFTLEGVTYYQQTRTCNKATCRCRHGEPHGPYWYQRDTHGRIQYLGRTLPTTIEQVRVARERLLGSIRARHRELQREAAALGQLLDAAPLDDDTRAIIERLGFITALLPRSPLIPLAAAVHEPLSCTCGQAAAPGAFLCTDCLAQL